MPKNSIDYRHMTLLNIVFQWTYIFSVVLYTLSMEFTYEFYVHNVYLNNGSVPANKIHHKRQIVFVDTFKLIRFAASYPGEVKTETFRSLFFQCMVVIEMKSKISEET